MDKAIPQHKRLAMGDTIKGYAKGGRIGLPEPNMVANPTGKAINPLRAAKTTNGVPGFKKGGKAEK